MVGRGVPFKIWQKIQVLLKQKVKSIQKTLIGHKKNQTCFFFCPHQFERSSTSPELTEYSLTVTQLSIVYLQIVTPSWEPFIYYVSTCRGEGGLENDNCCFFSVLSRGTVILSGQKVDSSFHAYMNLNQVMSTQNELSGF